MHIVVVANGELPDDDHRALRDICASADRVIAADGGLSHCETLGVKPDALVGDLDSAPASLVASAQKLGVHVTSYPSDKDATDLELALIAATKHRAKAITVIGAFGGRLDHELATIGLLTRSDWLPATVSATDGRRSLWVVRSSLALELSIGETLSLVPWGGDVIGVRTQGLQWPLHGDTLPLGSTRGVSNVVDAKTQIITIDAGTLLAVTTMIGV